jgi:hypothetical protein
MLFWTWFFVAVLVGIDVGAEILGVGPQAYIGGLITGLAFVWSSKLWPKHRSAQESAESVYAHKRSPPPIPTEFRDAVDAHARNSRPTTASPKKSAVRPGALE